MSQRTRRTLFILFTLLFALAATGVVLYASGYTFSFSDLSIKKTGAIFVEFEPRTWSLFLNNKPMKNDRRFLSGGTFLRDLAPKSYEVRVEKPGYHPWSKKLDVLPALVSKASDLILLPQHIATKPVLEAGDVANFWISESGILYITQGGALHHFYRDETTDLRGDTVITQSKNASRFVTAHADEKENVYRLYDTRSLTSFLNLDVLFANLHRRAGTVAPYREITAIIPHPFDSRKWLIETDRGLYVVDEEHLELSTIEEDAITAVHEDGSGIYYYGEKTGLVRYDAISKGRKQLYPPLGSDAIVDIKAGIDNYLGLLTREGNLYLFEASSGALTRLAHDARFMIFSADGGKLAYLDGDGTLTVHFLKDYFGLVHKSSGQSLQFKLPGRSNIQELIWYSNENYLIVAYQNTPYLLELDEPERAISYELPGFDTKLHFDPATKTFYVDKDGKLLSYRLEE